MSSVAVRFVAGCLVQRNLVPEADGNFVKRRLIRRANGDPDIAVLRGAPIYPSGERVTERRVGSPTWLKLHGRVRNGSRAKRDNVSIL